MLYPFGDQSKPKISFMCPSSVIDDLPVLVSQTLPTASKPLWIIRSIFTLHMCSFTYPVANRLPSDWNEIAYTSLACPSCNKSSCVVSTSQRRQVPSKLALPRYLPDGWNPIRATRPAWPDNVAIGVSLNINQHHVTLYINMCSIYFSKFHNRINPSAAPVAKLSTLLSKLMVDSGWNATPPTLSLCPFNVIISSHLGTLHILQRPDHAPVTNIFESGLKAHWATGRSSVICEPQFI